MSLRKKLLGVKSIETKHMEERETLFRGLHNLDRRSFLRGRAAALGAAVGAGITPRSFQPVKMVHAQPVTGKVQQFVFAYISDSHLYERSLNERFVNALMRAVSDINAMDPQPDFVLY